MTFSTKKTELGFTDSMPYGKFKGEKIHSVMARDPDYMRFFIVSSSGLFTYSENVLRTHPLPARK